MARLYSLGAEVRGLSPRSVTPGAVSGLERARAEGIEGILVSPELTAKDETFGRNNQI